MALVRWDPARELDVLQSDMNRLFDTFFQGRGSRSGGNGMRRWIPPMDLTETDDRFVLRADLPGLAEDDVDIEVKDGTLIISGERKTEHEERREGFHRVERASGGFLRSLDLPQGIDPGGITANFERGVLEVRIPKPAEKQPTKVQIGGSGERALESESEEADGQ
jgi:HSP20 family protein